MKILGLSRAYESRQLKRLRYPKEADAAEVPGLFRPIHRELA